MNRVFKENGRGLVTDENLQHNLEKSRLQDRLNSITFLPHEPACRLMWQEYTDTEYTGTPLTESSVQ